LKSSSTIDCSSTSRQRRLTERSWNTNDQGFSFDGLTQIDFIAGRALKENIKAGELVANLDECSGRAVKGSGSSRGIESQSTESSSRHHYDNRFE